MMGLPITVLENILHNGIVKPANPENPTMPATTDSIELKTGEIVTVEELCDFWIEGHKKILETTKIINDAKSLMEESKEKECNTTGKDILIQNQTTGKRSRKSTKKTTTTQK